MKNTIHQTKLKFLATCVVLGGAMLLAAGQAPAQTIYRVKGPDGRVTFSDTPPASSDKATAVGAGGTTVDAGGATLPFALRQVASKYPVTLYISNNCAPCDLGRALLNRRGVPFTEKTITSAKDAAALQRLSGESSLPLLTIGDQQIKGFSDAEWTQFLDAAGYPKSSTLPAGYRAAAATPLVTVQKPDSVAKSEESRPPRTPEEPIRPPTQDSPSNPAGIRF